jgi:NTE family protein
MKALIISGGGSKGAFAGGIAQYLIDDCCNDYELFVGCSTGSLLLPHLALGKIDKIKAIYTNVSQGDIFSINPFVSKMTEHGVVTKINHFNSVLSFIKGSPTFGQSKNLQKLIHKNLTELEYQNLIDSKKQVIVTVSNITKETIEYYNSKNCDRDEFCEWLWASCNYIPFMSLMSKNGYQYADGGFGSFVPIACAIENGATDIDVIILEPEDEHKKPDDEIVTNPFSLLLKTFQFMKNSSSDKDIIIGKLQGMNKNININFYNTPRNLTENPLVFNTDEMRKWWAEGYEYAKSKSPASYCHIPKTESDL